MDNAVGEDKLQVLKPNFHIKIFLFFVYSYVHSMVGDQVTRGSTWPGTQDNRGSTWPGTQGYQGFHVARDQGVPAYQGLHVARTQGVYRGSTCPGTQGVPGAPCGKEPRGTGAPRGQGPRIFKILEEYNVSSGRQLCSTEMLKTVKYNGGPL